MLLLKFLLKDIPHNQATTEKSTTPVSETTATQKSTTQTPTTEGETDKEKKPDTTPSPLETPQTEKITPSSESTSPSTKATNEVIATEEPQPIETADNETFTNGTSSEQNEGEVRITKCFIT